jgi:putative addiction module component (TIGR02574 family)
MVLLREDLWLRLLTVGPRGKIDGMSRTEQAVFAEALRLEPETRAELAAELLASLDGPADPGAEAAWDIEIERRIAAIEAGTIQLESWSVVKRRIEREILGR